MNELSNCPFCGKNNVKLNHTSYFLDPSDEIRYFVMCSECQTEGPVDIGKSGAIEAWNTRPEEDKLKARIAELEAAARWIPVEERLPANGQRCLCTFQYGEEIDIAIFMNNVRDFFGYVLNNVWVSIDDDGCHHQTGTVTHWRPLPQPPEAK